MTLVLRRPREYFGLAGEIFGLAVAGRVEGKDPTLRVFISKEPFFVFLRLVKAP